ncbi:hypothetical protein [Burkholderia sp. Ax-1719]|uniref:hypothetical protein n=1 Tax=Burkholderia sp. Ax-1719 TaxID=2608334 RepID=UPI00141F4539|nr:hypothetical protein [Burkholderia sp. Ax-1719]NIE66850.1 hypothetical protein [Burkholderia sp. Ax-1719]
MKQPLHSEYQLNKVELALIAAIRLTASMDRSARLGSLIFVPEIVTWALEKSEPAVIQALADVGQLTNFADLLRHYAKLRPIAECLRISEHLRGCMEAGVDYDDNGCLTPMDMLFAVRSGEWKCSERVAYGAITRALRFVVGHEEDTLPASSPAWHFDLTRSQTASDAKTKSVDEAYAADELDSALQPPLDMAITHARRELLACDTGDDPSFWRKVYTSVLGDWLQTDMPEVAAEILEKGLTAEYFSSAWVYVSQMQKVERFWSGLGSPIRELLLTENDEACGVALIAEVVRADGSSVDENEVIAWSKRVWRMMQRRSSCNSERGSDPIRSIESNAFLDFVRECANAIDTCYFADIEMLPASFRECTDETRVLVVRLPEPWSAAPDELASQPGLDSFFWRTDRGNEYFALAISRAFWCDYEKLLTHLPSFRRSIPVLYVFEGRCALARYRFQHFSDLRALVDTPYHWRSLLHISDEDWGQDKNGSAWISVLPDGSRIKPSLLSNVVDMTGGATCRKLSETYLREKPDAVLSREQRIIDEALDRMRGTLAGRYAGQ